MIEIIKGDCDMSLQDEITRKRKDIVVDAYPMSIGEIVNLYKEKELDIHPEFQRFFRWDNEQKTNLIESILLGIPIPPIFVSQKQSGKWDVIDGQQRLSSILQFVQVLKNDDDQLTEPLILQRTKFLPSLERVKWDDDSKFTSEQRITFKREKLNFTIIKESGENDDAKYELFQRLNTGGTCLSPQEIRNCLLIMINKQFYSHIISMSQDEHFLKCFPLTDLQQEQRLDLEFVVRFLVYRVITPDTVDRSRNMDSYLTDEIEKIARLENYDINAQIEIFTEAFALLEGILGEDVFKRYKDSKFTGTVLISAFEAIIPGLSEDIIYWKEHPEELKLKIQNLYETTEYINATRRGIRPIDRMVQLITFSRSWFTHED